jgi:hypothetical protein
LQWSSIFWAEPTISWIVLGLTRSTNYGKKDKNLKGFNHINPAQPQGRLNSNRKDQKSDFQADTNTNEKLPIPERKLKKGEKLMGMQIQA